MNVFEQIQSYAPEIEKEDALSFLERASSLFLNSLPEKVANNHFVEEEIPVNGVSVGNRYSFVLRGNYMCRKTRPDIVPLHKDESSSNFASSLDPVYYIHQGIIYVIPEPTEEEKAFVSQLPTIKINKENIPSAVPQLPKEASDIAVLYAGFFSNFYLAQLDLNESKELRLKYVQNLNKFNSSLPEIENIEFNETIEAPEEPTIEDINISFDDIVEKEINLSDYENVDIDIRLNELNTIDLDVEVPDFSIQYDSTSVPTYTPPTNDEPSTDFTASNQALENAKEFIGSINDAEAVPQGAYWLDDEDPEMVRSSVELAAQEVSRANGYSTNELSKLKSFGQELQNRFTAFKSESESFNNAIDFKIKDLQARLSSFTSELDAKTKEASFQLKKYQSKIESQIEAINSELEQQKTKSSVEVEKENLRLKSYLETINASITQKKIEIEQKVSNIRNKIQIYSVNIQSFQSEITNKLSLYSTQVSENIQMFNSRLQLSSAILSSMNSINSEFQILSNSYQSKMNSAERLYNQYVQEFKNYVGADNANERPVRESRER